MSTQSSTLPQYQNLDNCPIAVFYDIETCPVPDTYAIGNNIRRAFRDRQINGRFHNFSSYADFARYTLRARQGLSLERRIIWRESSGCSILCDMILFARDNPPPACILLISVNANFSEALRRLSMRGYTTILAIPASVSSTLRDASRFVWDWPSLSEASSSFNYLATQSPLHRIQNINRRSVAVLWDIESCPVPSNISTEDAAGNIRTALQAHPRINGSVSIFSAYGDFKKFSPRILKGLQKADVQCRDVPKGVNPFNTILVDLLFLALEKPRLDYIMLISGDEDFCQALSYLQNRVYTTIAAIPSRVDASSPLRWATARRLVWDWPSLSETVQ